MTDYIEPLVQESTPSIIADKLRKAIGYGEIKPGSQLAEADLARKLGVSRGPLREGMQRLTQEGLLISIRNRGLFVVDLTPDDIRDMYVARQAIELAAARQILAGEFEAAGKALSAFGHAMLDADGDPGAIGELDIEFHETLVRLSGSPRLIRMHQTSIIETRMCIHALEETYLATDVRAMEHSDLAEAIGAGNVARTEMLLLAHMDDAIERLVNR
ncbi:GntR family transcriptional regulator [Kribbella solani]|uniref:DNA-binding GntR family transcriptional regulator n=1 Tax=Kribbella solani TaxID=236067 RepID=A0A841DJ37_9ACTN|nr:FCD domain-containing protein [Kribbella solani]MBB5979164.1 DNA-binding GntR family transcriptional regulator [Kribbella solani]MDX2973465.1 GntR family transcriptional regulator [Kribbella solani]MDX3000125.1 GntR family transcriptional regulator [Kribbella solani]